MKFLPVIWEYWTMANISEWLDKMLFFRKSYGKQGIIMQFYSTLCWRISFINWSSHKEESQYFGCFRDRQFWTVRSLRSFSLSQHCTWVVSLHYILFWGCFCVKRQHASLRNHFFLSFFRTCIACRLLDFFARTDQLFIFLRESVA